MAHAAPVAAPRAPAMSGMVRAPPVSSERTFSCPDCGELFPSFPAQLLHQLASEPAHAPLAAEPTPVAAPAAGAGAGTVDGIAAAIAAAVTAAMTPGGVGAAGAPAAVSAPAPAGAGAVEHFAPKHGVRLLRNALDVAMIVPLLYAEPVIALDLEGDLTPGETQGVDLMQLYLPSVDLALLVHTASMEAAEVSRLLGPWLTSAAHHKILCDCRADSEALQVVYGVRLQGVIDVQVLHAVLKKELAAAAKPAAKPPFFFPTGLSKLAAQYGGDELGVAAGDLKTRFSAIFGAEGRRDKSIAPGRPFRQLPLTADAVAYAALDAWNTWLVHEALWPRAVAEGLSAAVVAMSERRACDFRDCADGRALWEVAMGEAKERRREGKDGKKGREQRGKATEQRAEPRTEASGGQPTSSPQSVPREKGKRARHEKPEKAGPPGKVQCEVCGIQMDDVPGTLAAHRKGKRHLLAAAVCAKQAPPPLRAEWRPEKESKEANPLGPDDVRQAFAAFGGVRSVVMAEERGANGRWSATVEFDSSAAAAHAVGCRQLIVNDKAVTSEPLGVVALANPPAVANPPKKQRVG